MNQVKTRLVALSLLDRALRSLEDTEIVRRYQALDEEGQDAVQHIAGVKGSELDDAGLVSAIRETANKGRINGDLERLSLLLTDDCLNDCIELLGDDSDDPSEEQLLDVLPEVSKKHGLAATQMMLATVVCGEAVASPHIIRILKTNDDYKLPPAEVTTTAPVVLEKEETAERAALREQRKARKAAEQEAARKRREQSAKAKRR
ncbi:MAG: hypothetical protein O3B19_08455 [Actinomycetota bacterium]|nr:hypothetical protein [Actinomycetota bacterium]